MAFPVTPAPILTRFSLVRQKNTSWNSLLIHTNTHTLVHLLVATYNKLCLYRSSYVQRSLANTTKYCVHLLANDMLRCGVITCSKIWFWNKLSENTLFQKWDSPDKWDINSNDHKIELLRCDFLLQILTRHCYLVISQKAFSNESQKPDFPEIHLLIPTRCQWWQAKLVEHQQLLFRQPNLWYFVWILVRTLCVLFRRSFRVHTSVRSHPNKDRPVFDQ